MRILVSGVSKGIGRALFKRLALDGHQVLGLARNQGRLSQLESEIYEMTL